MEKLTYITHHFHAKAGCVFREEADGILAKQLLYTIASEHQSGNQEYLIIRQAMAIVLHLVARNLMQTDFEQVGENKKVQDVMKLITYIQQHIGNRKLLSIESLASTFGIAKSYLGDYFKKQVGGFPSRLHLRLQDEIGRNTFEAQYHAIERNSL